MDKPALTDPRIIEATDLEAKAKALRLEAEADKRGKFVKWLEVIRDDIDFELDYGRKRHSGWYQKDQVAYLIDEAIQELMNW